jgi:hypothetical protein
MNDTHTATPTTRPAFGQRVTAEAKARRRTVFMARFDVPPFKSVIETSYFPNSSVRWKVWERKTGMVNGLYIGYRTVFDGRSWWEDEEVGMVFVQERYMEAWLIVPNERRNPVYVFPEDVTWQSEEA